MKKNPRKKDTSMGLDLKNLGIHKMKNSLLSFLQKQEPIKKFTRCAILTLPNFIGRGRLEMTIFRLFFFAAIVFNFFLASWYVLNHDIDYTSEVARDLLLMQEVVTKKFVLIGPNSTTGLFHGPLWTYLNVPAYIIGNGNPIVVGWYWVILVALFVVSGFFIAKKLFNSSTAYLYTLMISLYMIFHVREFYNPHGAMLILPAYFFFFIKYIQTSKVRYLLFHTILSGALIHFQMAIGIPFLMLSFAYAAAYTINRKKIVHLLAYGLTILELGNFFLFDIRHQFLLSHLVIQFLTSDVRNHPNVWGMFVQRLQYLTTGVEFFRVDRGFLNIFAVIIFLFFFTFQWKDNKYRLVYSTFLYFYGGFFVLSFLNSGGLLYFYVFPLFPLVFLIFSSFVTSRFRIPFIIIFFIVYFANSQTAIADIQYASSSFFGKSLDSWSFYTTAAHQVFAGKEQELGYFIYSPDVVGYRGQYALFYYSKLSDKKVYSFTKMPVTYLFIAPPPVNNPYMQDLWWRENEIHIMHSPITTIHFVNGYKIEKYELSHEEIKVPFDPNVNPGIHFR